LPDEKPHLNFLLILSNWKPVENAFIESFNENFTKECLNIMNDTDHKLSNTRSYVLVFLLFVVFTTFLKIPTVNYSHQEPDEIIYLELARQILENGEYTLRGTEILTHLSPNMYDRPLFHHPPLYPILLTPFVWAGMENWAVITSWLGHIMCLAAVAIFAWTITIRVTTTKGPFHPCFWIPLLGISLDPILVFVSRKIWIDNVLAGFVALSISMVLLSGHSRYRRLILCGSGILLGLAGLTKITGLIAVPLITFLILQNRRSNWKDRRVALLCVFIPAAVMVTPWLIIFQVKCGALLPTWAKADDWLIEHYPFVKAFLDRPLHYYPWKLLLISPILFLNGYWIYSSPAVRKDQDLHISLAWLSLFLIAITYLSASGVGYLMRHISSAVPAMYILTSVGLSYKQKKYPLSVMLSVLLISYSTATSCIYLLMPKVDEISSFFEIIGMTAK
jgi:4-amino-4-deoxy-L-arabinose transferase-like glycosyltransferase